MIDEKSKRLNELINNVVQESTRIKTIESLIIRLNNFSEKIYDLMTESNNNYKDLSAIYVSHLLSGNDSVCERYNCRDAMKSYKDSVEFYMDFMMDIKWLMDELYALRIVELCRTGV